MNASDKPLSFTARLLNEVAEGAAENHTDNRDEWGGVPQGKISHRADTSRGRKYNAISPEDMATYAPLFPQFERVVEWLEDEASRDLLAKVIAYRLLGRHAIKLPFNAPEYREMEQKLAARAETTDIATGMMAHRVERAFRLLHKIDMRPDGFDLTVIGQPREAVTEFLLNRYRCPDLGLAVAPGDIVIDGGACWGESALRSAAEAGPEGRVFAFEFDQDNLSVLYKALDLNPNLKNRIEVIQIALWDESDLSLACNLNGPRSRITLQALDENIAHVDTVTIDDFVDEQELERVDFIKLDIEGSESKALRGARRTIERFRPKLALGIASQPNHYVELPRLLEEWVPFYRLRMGHYTMNHRGSVLYAVAGD